MREHRLELRRLIEPEVRHDDHRLRMPIERAPQAIGARDGPRVQAIARVRRLRPAMDHHRLAPSPGSAPHRIEAGIVGSDLHHVRVDLHPAEGTGQRFFEDLFLAFLAREDGAAGDHLGVPPGDVEREIVQGAREAWLVNVRERHHPRDAALAQDPHGVVHARPVLDVPGMRIEPPPDRLGEPVRMQVHMGVDDDLGGHGAWFAARRQRAQARPWTSARALSAQFPALPPYGQVPALLVSGRTG